MTTFSGYMDASHIVEEEMDQVEEVENVRTESYKKTWGPDVDWKEEEIFSILKNTNCQGFIRKPKSIG